MPYENNLKTKILKELETVIDPEIKKPITELNMVKKIEINDKNEVILEILLTIAGCPLKDEIINRVEKALKNIDDITSFKINLSAMTDEEREQLRTKLRGPNKEPIIPFNQPNNMTKVFAVASGKGGVGKSTVTVNLAIEAAKKGLNVGIIDADIYGHSIPGLLGSTKKPTKIEGMILPPIEKDIKHISIDQFTKGNNPVIWRGPMLHRALQQFLADVYWGDLDILFLDLPPGTGDIAISVAQLLPNSQLLIVTTPQSAATNIAERAGAIASQTKQKISGVIENMAGLEMPDGNIINIFGEGGGKIVAENLSKIIGTDIPLLGSIPIDTKIRIAGDEGKSGDKSDYSEKSANAFSNITDKILKKSRGLVGIPLGLDPK